MFTIQTNVTFAILVHDNFPVMLRTSPVVFMSLLYPL